MAAAGTNAGKAAIKVTFPSLESAEIEIDCKEAYVKAGISANTSNYHVDTDENEIPIRKIEIASTEGMILDKEHPETVLTAKCYPSYSTYDELEWSVLNDAGEHGVATPRHKESYIGFENVDFGSYGTDEVEINIFTHDRADFVVQLWLEIPGEEGSELIDDMDFKDGVSRITIKGTSYTEVNTLNIIFVGEDGSQTRQMIEFTHTDNAEEKTFDINPIKGKNKVTFVFLPGSNFDFEWFRFE